MAYTDLMAKYIAPLHPIPAGMRPSGELKKPVKAVLFDVYGTILISQSGDISIAKNKAQTASRLKDLIKTYRYAGSVDDLVDAFFYAIESTHEAMHRQGIDFPEVAIDRIWMQVLGATDIETARRFAIEFEMIANPGYPMPHLADILTSLRDKGMIMGIISNAQFFTPILFETLCGAPPEKMGFSPGLIFYSYQYGVAKPSRRLFQLA
ncbi:MAG: HAD family hydrolase, partial [Desulfobacterales bacterium]|nr:HAD family hydrolase [Desulfobacterales bacterium]